MDSSIELIVTYFAVLMAGKAFAPLETTLPPAALTGVLSALHEHANLTHHIVSVDGRRHGRTGPLHPTGHTHAGHSAIEIRNLIREMTPRREPRLEVHESGVPVTVIRCADTFR